MSNAAGAPDPRPTRSHRLALIVAAIACAASFFGLVAVANRGFGLTDEAYYVLLMQDPGAYRLTLHIFGYAFSPVLDLLGGSITALRIFGFAALAATGAILGQFIVWRHGGLLPSRALLPVLGALFALSHYCYWILSPNYNLLANIGGSLVAGGLIGWMIPADRRRRGVELFASLCVAAGGAYAFLAKPHFAFVAALAAGGILIWTLLRESRGLALRRALTAASVAVLLLLVIIGTQISFSEFFSSVRSGVQVAAVGGPITALPRKILVDLYFAPPIFYIALTAALFAFAIAASRVETSRAVEGLLRAILAVALVWAVAVTAYFTWHARYLWEIGPFVFSVVVAQLGLFLLRHGLRNGHGAVASTALLLLLLPFAITLGTVNNILHMTTLSMFGFLLASALLLQAGRRSFGSDAAAALLCLAVPLLLLAGARAPFQMPEPISTLAERTASPFSNDTFLLDPPTAEAFRRMAALRPQRQRVPMFDLSGLGPGNVLLLGGHTAGNPFLSAFFAGGPARADAFWEAMPEEDRRSAWIIGPIDERFAGARVVDELLRSSSRYRCIGEVTVSTGFHHYPISVWRPALSPAEPAGPCTVRALRLFRPGWDVGRMRRRGQEITSN